VTWAAWHKRATSPIRPRLRASAMTLPADRMYVICVLEERRCHQLSASQSAWQQQVDSL
jgi:hypothetical protein